MNKSCCTEPWDREQTVFEDGKKAGIKEVLDWLKTHRWYCFGIEAKFRHKHKLTQVQLAEKLGVTSQTVANWEQGLARPSRLAKRELERIRRKS